MIKNNKDEVPFTYYQNKYSQIDPIEASSRCGLPYDESNSRFTMRHMGRDYYIYFPEFRLVPVDGEENSAVICKYKPAHILFIRYLISGSNAAYTDNFKSYRDFPWGEVYYGNFRGRCILRLTGLFGKRPEALAEAMKKIEGKSLENSDHGYEFEFLNNLKVRFLLWEGDEEFPPSMQILFSENFALAFSAEDMAVVGDIFITTLQKI